MPPRHLYETWDDKPGLLAGIRDGQRLTGWTEDRWRELRATYYGMCARVDHQFGLLLGALRESGLYDGSAVFLFSDHGDFTGDSAWWRRRRTRSRIASAVCRSSSNLPGRAGHTRYRDQLVELLDFPATVYDLPISTAAIGTLAAAW